MTPQAVCSSIMHRVIAELIRKKFCKRIKSSVKKIPQKNFRPTLPRALRNANDYYIPQPRIELVKRMPLFAFPSAWNSEDIEKYIPQPADLPKISEEKITREYAIVKFLYHVPPPPIPPTPPPPPNPVPSPPIYTAMVEKLKVKTNLSVKECQLSQVVF